MQQVPTCISRRTGPEEIDMPSGVSPGAVKRAEPGRHLRAEHQLSITTAVVIVLVASR